MNVDFELSMARERALTKGDKPHLMKGGFGWYCMGQGLRILALTPLRAYEAWEFARTGYPMTVLGIRRG